MASGMLLRMENNEKIAALLREIADLLEYQGVAFKPAAYRRAAQTVEGLSMDVATLKTEKELKALPGIGDAIAKKILEFFESGEMSFLTELRSEVGGGASGLMRIDDLGPKRVKQLQELGISDVPSLIKAAESGKLRELPRFSEVMERKILNNARNVTERVKRYPLAEIESDVKKLLKALRAARGVVRCDAAGSYRRRKETVGDIDILIAFDDAKTGEDHSERIAKVIQKIPIVDSIVAQGNTRLAFNLKTGLRVDIRVVDLKQWGSAFLYFTGDKEHNISLRRLAIIQGMKLNEYALLKGENVVASAEEADIYKALGLPFIEPQERTGDLPE